MDLGICPRCGMNWVVGRESCSACSFIAIGAGLSKTPKKKRAVRPYREPGSGSPFTLSIIAVIAIGSMINLKPITAEWNRLVHGGSGYSQQQTVVSNQGGDHSLTNLDDGSKES